jgi:hypothetical protein
MINIMLNEETTFLLKTHQLCVKTLCFGRKLCFLPRVSTYLVDRLEC